MLSRLRSVLLGFAVVIMGFAALPVSLLFSARPVAGAPVLVVAPPWGAAGDAAQIVQTERGRLIGPVQASFAVLALVDDPARLSRAGAWAVLDGRRIARLCGFAMPAERNLP